MTISKFSLPLFDVKRLTSLCARVARVSCIHLLVFLGCWCAEASAAEPAAVGNATFAHVWRIEGDIGAENSAGSRLLKLGDAVAVGDRLTASANGEAVLKTLDAGYIAIRPGANFIALQFKADGKGTDTSRFELLKGALRIISGWIGKLNRRGSTLSTPTATVGIRGTDHEPYVLLSEDEEATRFKPGTYDKVNQGGTTLQAAGQSVDIDPGKVGFARSPGKSRALLTLLFPVLLEKIPDFYVPGKFDAEMNEWAANAAANNESELQAKRKQVAACVPGEVAKRWTHDLDERIVKGDAAAILSMFARDVRVKATVRAGNGKMTTIELEGVELADSIVAAVSSLRDYKHRRITLEGKAATASDSTCGPVAIKSIVIEEGRQADKPYRFESEETYVLELIDSEWRASKAETRQR
jgi:hypothetical protein